MTVVLGSSFLHFCKRVSNSLTCPCLAMTCVQQFLIHLLTNIYDEEIFKAQQKHIFSQATSSSSVLSDGTLKSLDCLTTQLKHTRCAAITSTLLRLARNVWKTDVSPMQSKHSNQSTRKNYYESWVMNVFQKVNSITHSKSIAYYLTWLNSMN